MLKNRRSATPTKDKSPSASGDAASGAAGSRKTSSSSLTFFNRGPNRSSLNSDRFNANRSADSAGAAAFAVSVPHWCDQGRLLAFAVALSVILTREFILAIDLIFHIVFHASSKGNSRSRLTHGGCENYVIRKLPYLDQ